MPAARHLRLLRRPTIPESTVTWIAIGALAAAGLSLLVSLFALTRRPSTRKPVAASRPDPTLADVSEQIDQLQGRLTAIAGRLEVAEGTGNRSMQNIGVVRFNPFADTGSNQSFALALLDSRGDGFVLSSMHSRQQTRVFLKAVVGGKTESAVSDEEVEAIRRAVNRDKTEGVPG